jgi:hypothetical protein
MTGDYTHASTEEMERAMELVASYKRKQVLTVKKSRQNRERQRTCNPLLFCK